MIRGGNFFGALSLKAANVRESLGEDPLYLGKLGDKARIAEAARKDSTARAEAVMLSYNPLRREHTATERGDAAEDPEPRVQDGGTGMQRITRGEEYEKRMIAINNMKQGGIK